MNGHDGRVSHGNVAVTTGTCHCCKRDSQPLTSRSYCADEFTCYDAFTLLPSRRRRRHVPS